MVSLETLDRSKLEGDEEEIEETLKEVYDHGYKLREAKQERGNYILLKSMDQGYMPVANVCGFGELKHVFDRFRAYEERLNIEEETQEDDKHRIEYDTDAWIESNVTMPADNR